MVDSDALRAEAGARPVRRERPARTRGGRARLVRAGKIALGALALLLVLSLAAGIAFAGSASRIAAGVSIQGVNVGGNMYQQFGVMDEYFKVRGKPITDADLGRYTVTKLDADRFVFKVPSLRNVELTAQYFHDGTAGTLEDAVDVMFRYQLGRTAPAGDKSLIVKFLKTLTGEKEIK